MDFSTHPFALAFDDDRCTLTMQVFGFDPLHISKHESAGDLLAILLNRRYYPDLITLEQFRALGTRSNFPQMQPWYYWLDEWDHKKVETIIRDIYLSDDKSINALKPSQRFRIHLAFQSDMFMCEYVEQPYAHPRPILDAEHAAGRSLPRMTDSIREVQRVTQEQAMYIAGCRLAEEQKVRMPSQVQYWFATPNDLILWLLRYVIEQDRYIKVCELCGRYFVPKRNTKKYCSDACTNTQRDLDSFCGVEEAKRLYKRIVSNLRDKGKRMVELGQPYYSQNHPGEWLDPRDVLKQFYSVNAEYLNTLRTTYEAVKKATPPTEAQTEEFESAKGAYLDWLQERYEFATALVLDRDADFRVG